MYKIFNKLFNLIEGGIITTALFIIFGKIQEVHQYSHTIKDDEIIFDNFGDAASVLSYCEEAVDKFGFVTVLMLKHYVKDITGKEMPRKSDDYRLGWKSLDGVNIKKNFKGYYIDFPVPKEEFYLERGNNYDK